MVSGAFCLSSSVNGPNVPGTNVGGTGWIIGSQKIHVSETTTADEPFLTMDIDPGRAEAAKNKPIHDTFRI